MPHAETSDVAGVVAKLSAPMLAEIAAGDRLGLSRKELPGELKWSEAIFDLAKEALKSKGHASKIAAEATATSVESVAGSARVSAMSISRR